MKSNVRQERQNHTNKLIVQSHSFRWKQQSQNIKINL